MKLKELRENKKLSQTDIAKIFNIKQNTISRYENNIQEPNFELLIKFANYFDVTIDYLLENTEENGITYPQKFIEVTEEEKELLQKYQQLNSNEKRYINISVNTLLKDHEKQKKERG